VAWIVGWKMGLDRIMIGQKVLCGWGENQETPHKIMETMCKFTGDEI
jgi:hypothetical protein